MNQTCRVITNVYLPGTAFRAHMGIKVQKIPLEKMKENREELLKVPSCYLEGEILCTVGETTIQMEDDLSCLWQQVLNAMEDLLEAPFAMQEFPDSSVAMCFQIPEEEPDTIVFWIDFEKQNRIRCDRKLLLSALLDGAETFFHAFEDAMADVDLTQYPLYGEPREPDEYQFGSIQEWIDRLRGKLLTT